MIKNKISKSKMRKAIVIATMFFGFIGLSLLSLISVNCFDDTLSMKWAVINTLLDHIVSIGAPFVISIGIICFCNITLDSKEKKRVGYLIALVIFLGWSINTPPKTFEMYRINGKKVNVLDIYMRELKDLREQEIEEIPVAYSHIIQNVHKTRTKGRIYRSYYYYVSINNGDFVLPVHEYYRSTLNCVLMDKTKKHTLSVYKNTKFIQGIDGQKLTELHDVLEQEARENSKKLAELEARSDGHQFLFDAADSRESNKYSLIIHGGNTISYELNVENDPDVDDLCIAYFNDTDECRIQVKASEKMNLHTDIALKSKETIRVYLTEKGWNRVSNVIEYDIDNKNIVDMRYVSV